MSSASVIGRVAKELKRQNDLVHTLIKSQRTLEKQVRRCLDTKSSRLGHETGHEPLQGLPTILPRVFSIVHANRSCSLGNTLPFKLFARLLAQPNEFVSYAQLRADVWDNTIRTHGAIRSVVRDLRARLRQEKMDKVAEAIDGSVASHYSFTWPERL